MDLHDHLAGILEEHQEYLTAHAWPSEAGRWAELVFCLLHGLRPENSQDTRQAVQVLFATGLLNIEALSSLGKKAEITFTYILTSHGWSEPEADEAITMLRKISRVIRKRFHGKVQSVVRRFAIGMRQELSAAFRGAGLNKTDLDRALNHWMQNAFNLPVSLEQHGLQRFSRAIEISPEEILRAADELDINFALLDDILEAHSGSQSGAGQNSKITQRRLP
jgi:hypothetical protein